MKNCWNNIERLEVLLPKFAYNKRQHPLNQEQLNVLSSIVSDNNDATLDELRILLEQKTGVLIGRSTLDRMLKKLNLNLKKKHYTPPKKGVNEFNH